MSNTEMLVVMANLTTAEYRAMRKALKTLLRCGIDYPSAIEMLCENIKRKGIR